MNGNPPTDDSTLMKLASMGSSERAAKIRAEDEALKKAVKASNKETKMYRKMADAGDIGGFTCMSFPAFGPVGPGMPVPKGVPQNFELKQSAIMVFQEGNSRQKSGRAHNFDGERQYREYFQDLQRDRANWLSFCPSPPGAVKHP